MPRILALQKMAAIGFDLGGLEAMTEASSCSYAGCGGCSSYSDSGCKPGQFFVAI